MALDHAAAARRPALYGILLGLGFTTFVLSFGVWALAGISVALGDPGAGVVIGAAFGVGRAIPVVAVAPVVDSALGIRCIELMAERPALYRIFRLGDAVTLGLVAAALGHEHRDGSADRGRETARIPRRPARRWPSSARIAPGFCGSAARSTSCPGRDPAVGGPYVAVISGGDRIQILNRYNREPIGSVPAPHAQALAISRELARLPDGRRRPKCAPGAAAASIPPIPAR